MTDGRLYSPKLGIDRNQSARNIDGGYNTTMLTIQKQSTQEKIMTSRRIQIGLLIVTVLLGLVFSQATAIAQSANATIRGQVLDRTDALVPGATVVIVNKNTGVTVFEGTTDAAGSFVAPQVLPGTYKV